MSALSKLSSMFSRLRCARWSPAGNSVSRVICPESVSDACGTREMRLDRAVGHVRLGGERAARLLLEHVEHGLQRHDRPVADRLEAFVGPPDRGAERDAELADLALDAELLELLPQRVVEDRLDARVVQLVQVDVVGAEAAQRRFELRPDRRGLPVVRTLRLPGESPGRVDVVSALGGEDDVVAVRLQDVGEQRLADAVVAVDRRGVDEVDAGVERGVQHALGVVDATPPVAGQGPHAEADLGDLEIAPTEAAIAHGKLPSAQRAAREIYCSLSRGSSTGRAGEGGVPIPRSRSSRSAARRP